MFNVGGGEVLVILLVALIVLGPDKLPGAVRKAGQVVSELRKISAGFQAEMRTAMLDDDVNRRIGARDPQPPAPSESGAAPGGTDAPADGGSSPDPGRPS